MAEGLNRVRPAVAVGPEEGRVAAGAVAVAERPAAVEAVAGPVAAEEAEGAVAVEAVAAAGEPVAVEAGVVVEAAASEP